MVSDILLVIGCLILAVYVLVAVIGSLIVICTIGSDLRSERAKPRVGTDWPSFWITEARKDLRLILGWPILSLRAVVTFLLGDFLRGLLAVIRGRP